MIHIDFEEPDTVVWKRWRKDCQEATAELVAAVDRGQAPEVTDLYRRKSVKDQVYFAKDGPFHGKCAYCECYLTDFQRGDIEHFRPKLAVTDENDNPVLVNDGSGNSKPHPGYYWLAYDWRNLLPSCAICNQPSTVDGRKIGKHNRFPVEGPHAVTPAEVGAESPLLINPVEEQDPHTHLSVDPATGLMKHYTLRGEMCIRIFGLNLRDRLPEERKKAANDVKAKFDEILHHPDPAAKQRALDDLKEIKDGKREYTAAARAALDSILPYLERLLTS